jgi:hypothetical protein
MQKDGSLYYWDLRLERLMALASETAGRNLTLAEWQQFLPSEPYRPTFLDWPYPPPLFLYRPFSINKDDCKRISTNLSIKAWNSFFPGQPYRKSFPDQPVPEARE